MTVFLLKNMIHELVSVYGIFNNKFIGHVINKYVKKKYGLPVDHSCLDISQNDSNTRKSLPNSKRDQPVKASLFSKFYHPNSQLRVTRYELVALFSYNNIS